MINTKEFSKRLKEVIDYHEESASSFAETIGVQRSSISHILSGRNKPSLDFIMKVLLAYPNADMYWLVYGKGVFPKTEASHRNLSSTDVKRPTAETKPINTDAPTLFPEVASAASPTETDASIDRIVIFYKDGRFKSYTP